MKQLLHRSRLRVAAAALALGATTAVMQAAPTSAAPAPTVTTATASSSLPCGFGYWQQSYRNCSRTYSVRVEATAHDSIVNDTVHYYYCLPPGTQKVPLAMWGQWVNAVYARAFLGRC